ncbi:MAG: MoaD/ThiS family protein [Ignisphaera sp.]
MVNKIRVTLKIFPPFSKSPNSIEKNIYLGENSTLMDLLVEASSQGLINIDEIIHNNEIKDGVVVMVNGRSSFNLTQKLTNNDRIVILPLAPGG